MSDAQPISVDVSALIDADWPEWRSALEDIRREYGDEGVRALLRRLQEYSIDQGVTLSDALLNTPYINTLSPEEQPPYPGDLELEKRIENIIRWNAAAMILRAHDEVQVWVGTLRLTPLPPPRWRRPFITFSAPRAGETSSFLSRMPRRVSMPEPI